jgi:hypothetical protein
MVRLMQLGFAAAALVMAAVSPAGSPARAFTFESLGGNSIGGSTLADPDDQVKNFGNGGTSCLARTVRQCSSTRGRASVAPSALSKASPRGRLRPSLMGLGLWATTIEVGCV